MIPGLGQFIQGMRAQGALFAIADLMLVKIIFGGETNSEKKYGLYLLGFLSTYSIIDSYKIATDYNSQLKISDNVGISYFGTGINLTVQF